MRCRNMVQKINSRIDAELNFILMEILNNTTQELYDQLITIIQSKIYESEPTWYTRTYQFSDSFVMDNAKLVGSGVVESNIYQDLSTMVWNAELFQHGNIYEPLKEHELADILNNGTNNSAFGFPPVVATKFWDEFEKYVNLNLDKIFQREARRYGLDLQVGISHSFN